MMASIATGPIAERTSLDTYIFFTFLTSAFIFPSILAWVWEDGWLQNLGFKDYAGAGIVHLSAGVAGFVGAVLTGPRLGKFHKEASIEYMLDDENFDDKLQLNQDRIEESKKKYDEDRINAP
jgi:ammonia channel protein AmtB